MIFWKDWPPNMKKYVVIVEEIIRREFSVRAESPEQAAELARSPECYITTKYDRDVLSVREEPLK